MSCNLEHDRLAAAQHASNCASARLWGMKYRASIDPPRSATGTFPYPARTCAEWTECSPFVPQQEKSYGRGMTNEQMAGDAERGSAKLRDAILRCAA